MKVIKNSLDVKSNQDIKSNENIKSNQDIKNNGEIMKAKEVFDTIIIPDELDQIMINTIKAHPRKPKDTEKVSGNNVTILFKRILSAAAVVLLFLVISLNTSETFAEAVGNLPVIGGVAKVLTVRSYHTSEDNKDISVKVPEVVVKEDQNTQNPTSDTIQGDNSKGDNLVTDENTILTGDTTQTKDTQGFVADINAEIQKVVDTYLADAKSRLQADKEAFIATGGTEEQWKERDLNIKVDYKVQYQHDNRLSIVLTADESWYGAYDLKYFYNLNLEDNTKLTLQDVLGSDFVTKANDSIIRQMKEKTLADANYVYWGVTEDSDLPGFTTVDDNTKFYLNKEGKPVICFDKYEIAPGFMGAQEFVIE